MRLIPIAAYKLIKVLEKAGFQPIRQKGSHLTLAHLDGRSTVVPVHTTREIEPRLLSKILREARISREEFFRLLKQILVLLRIIPEKSREDE